MVLIDPKTGYRIELKNDSVTSASLVLPRTEEGFELVHSGDNDFALLGADGTVQLDVRHDVTHRLIRGMNFQHAGWPKFPDNALYVDCCFDKGQLYHGGHTRTVFERCSFEGFVWNGVDPRSIPMIGCAGNLEPRRDVWGSPRTVPA